MKATAGLRGLFAIFFGAALYLTAATLFCAGLMLYGTLSSGRDPGTLAFSFSVGFLVLLGAPAWLCACIAGLFGETPVQARAMRVLWALLAVATLALMVTAVVG